MLLFLLMIIFLSKPKENLAKNLAIELPEDLEKLWINSQAMIFHHSDWTQKPDCFGNVLAPGFVITSASCFMDVTKVLWKHYI